MGATEVQIRICMFAVMSSVLAGAAPLVSQNLAAQPAGNAVSLDLDVHSQHKKLVLDLRPEDVTVTDNGKPAQLTDLRLVNGEQKNALITLLFDRPGFQDSGGKPEDFLFKASADSAQATSKRLRQEASRFLRVVQESRLQIAVMDVWGRLQIQQTFTEDRKAVDEAISSAVQPEVYGKDIEANAAEQRLARVAATGLDSSGSAASVRERTMARLLYTALSTSSQIVRDQHLSFSQACLLALVEAQQSLPGRKAIVYFASSGLGSGSPYGRSGKNSRAKDALRSIIGIANQAGVKIYVVLADELNRNQWADFVGAPSNLTATDAHGNTVSTMVGDYNRNENYNTISTTGIDEWSATLPSSPGNKLKPEDLAASEDATLLAEQTGGGVLNPSRDLKKPVNSLIQSLTTYYKASFVPPDSAEDGTFHTTMFKTSRKGLRARARIGYLALPPGTRSDNPLQPFEVPLVALLKRQELPGYVDYRAKVLNMERVDEDNIELAALEVPVSELQIQADSSTHLNSVHISVLATITDSAGTQIQRFSEDIVRHWSPQNRSDAAPEYITFERSFAAPPGKYVLETAILDNNSGKAAANRQTFEISATQSSPELSDLMVVRGIEPADDVSSELDILWGDGQIVRPNLYGTLPVEKPIVSVFFFAHLDPKSREQAVVKLDVLHDGMPLKGEPQSSTLKGGEEFSRVVKGFSLRSAVDGRYAVRVTLSQAGKSTERTVEFVLTGGEPQVARGSEAEAGEISGADPSAPEAAGPIGDRPTHEEWDGILADVRENALAYANSLPNLICLQTTQRLHAAAGRADWTLKDTILEQLTYVDHKESRTEIDKKNLRNNLGDISVLSEGEFGPVVANIFKPEAKAKFTWKETVSLRGEPAEVFEYSLAKENSALWIIALERTATVGYHGQIYVDRATHNVMRLTEVVDETPEKFFVRKAVIRVDYDYVAINNHDYILPVRAQLIAALGANSTTRRDLLWRDDIAFSDFRRFGSTGRIVDTGTAEAPR